VQERTIRIIEILMESFFPLLKAMLQFTVPLTIISFILGILVAFGVAIIRVFHIKPLIPIVKFYVWLIRGTPLMVQLFILFYGLPSVGVTLNAFTSAIIGFTLNIGAYNSETIRAAIESIDKGQWEAAHALGLTRWQTLIRIIFPQAIKVAVPPVSNSFIGLVKDTSLAATLTVTELFHKAQQITARTYEPLWLYLEAAFFYLILCSVLAYYQGKLEQKYNKYGT